jgi:hypothetical protein
MAKAKHREDRWKFIEIVWHDAISASTWCEAPETDAHELPDAAHILTRGWLVRETTRSLTLAASVDQDRSKRSVGDVITIPKGCIESRRELAI